LAARQRLDGVANEDGPRAVGAVGADGGAVALEAVGPPHALEVQVAEEVRDVGALRILFAQLLEGRDGLRLLAGGDERLGVGQGGGGRRRRRRRRLGGVDLLLGDRHRRGPDLGDRLVLLLGRDGGILVVLEIGGVGRRRRRGVGRRRRGVGGPGV